MSQGGKSLLTEKQLLYQKALAEGKTRREAKKYARVVSSEYKVPFLDAEKKFLRQEDGRSL